MNALGTTFRERMNQPIDLASPVPYLSPRQIADHVRHQPSWVWRKIRSRQLKASRWSCSGELRIAWEDFIAFLAAGDTEAGRVTMPSEGVTRLATRAH